MFVTLRHGVQEERILIYVIHKKCSLLFYLDKGLFGNTLFNEYRSLILSNLTHEMGTGEVIFPKVHLSTITSFFLLITFNLYRDLHTFINECFY